MFDTKKQVNEAAKIDGPVMIVMGRPGRREALSWATVVDRVVVVVVGRAAKLDIVRERLREHLDRVLCASMSAPSAVRPATPILHLENNKVLHR